MTTWGSKLIVATDPGMLMSLEHQCKDLNPSTSRVDAFRALTGIHNSERMTEVMGTRIMPVSSKILSPSGTLKSGLMETFNERLMYNFDALTAELKANGPKTMRLSDFISYHLFCASTNSLFGPTFPFDSYPHFAIISSSIQILHSPMANWPFVARKARRARASMIDALIKYTEDWWHNGGQIEGVSQLVGQSLIIMKEENLSIEEAAGSLLISLWGALFNVSAMTYWLTANLLVDEKIYTNLREEAVDKHYMEAPLLESAALETLRTGSVPPPTRSVDADAEIVVDGKRYFFEKGSRIISEMSGYHYNPDVYADPHSFKLERFFDESLPRPKPFGEGHHFVSRIQLCHMSLFLTISYL
jgi:cytochrome P450